jgi:hypothetical protein
MTLTQTWTIACFAADCDRPYRQDTATTARDARRLAARMLGRRSLRGASQWHWDASVAYHFGPRSDAAEYDVAVITAPDDRPTA